MKAVVVEKPHVLSIQDIPMPKCGDYDCLAKIRACGFCNGTDMQIIGGTLSHGNDSMVYPCVLGHEAACEVLQVGSKARHIKTGDRFIRPLLLKDDSNGYEITYGNMAEYAIVRDYVSMWEDGLMEDVPDAPYADNCARIPNDIDFMDGAMIVTLCEALSGIDHFNIGEGHEVLIYGAGPIGLAAAKFATIRGATVTIIDGIQERLDLAKKLGIKFAYNFKTGEFEKEQKDTLFDFVVDAVGSVQILLDGTWKLKSGGVACGLGVLKDDDAFINLKKIKNNTSVHMHNFQCYRFAYVDKIVEYIRDGKLNPKDFWTDILPMEEVEKAVQMTKNKESLKVMLEVR